MNQSTSKPDKQKFMFPLVLSVAVFGLIWFIYFIDISFGLGWQKFGVHPKQISGILGIFTYPFLHGSLEHLVSNTFPGIILLTGIFIFHPKNSFKMLPLLFIISGSLLWLIGECGSNHVGASGMVYGMAFYLFTAGVRNGDRNSMALAFFIILWYGSMIWGIFPFGVDAGTSWEGHLAGAVTGVCLAFFFMDKTPKKQLSEQHPIEKERHFYEEFPLD